MPQFQVRIIDDDIPLAQFAVAFQGASWTDPDSIALMVMQSMLGSWNKNAGGGKHMGWVFVPSPVLYVLYFWLFAFISACHSFALHQILTCSFLTVQSLYKGLQLMI